MKILSADDHWVSRTGLRHSLSLLEWPVNSFLEASSFAEAREIAAQNPDLDLIVMDLLMPDGSGFDELAVLTQIVPEVPIIVVSMAENRQDVIRAIDAGAMGFVPKSAPGTELVRAIEIVLAGEIYLPPQIMGAQAAAQPPKSPAIQPPRPVAPSESASARIADLTRRQREVFSLLGAGYSNAAIARELGISEHTVAIHVSAILKTLEVENRTQAALLATGGAPQQA
ncbi:MAG TPA: DNA-binding response regulator [Alphaproteobacteria bacterium]|nr:DNA-binding response regulator [Alphaproteobacteria bacterium]HCO89521.1 DNA-binding response regulator [Alphaproteobacteria bacterium]